MKKLMNRRNFNIALFAVGWFVSAVALEHYLSDNLLFGVCISAVTLVLTTILKPIRG